MNVFILKLNEKTTKRHSFVDFLKQYILIDINKVFYFTGKTKVILILFTLFWSLSSHCQNYDTLNLAKGEWIFTEMIIDGDTSLQTKNFHATDLKIDNGNFEIGLSEAYSSGKFSRDQKGIVGLYLFGDQVIDELRIFKIKKNRITIQLTTSSPEYWGGKIGQNIKVYLKYKRRK